MRSHLALLSLVALSGCALGFGDPTDSGFATPDASGDLSRVDSGARSGSDFSALTGNGYGNQVGAVDDDGLQGFAGLVSGATVSAPLTTGSTTMTGDFELAVIDFIIQNGTSVTGQSTLDRGNLTLNVDFENRRVTGGGTGLDGGISNIVLDNNVLAVDGQFVGDALTGTVTYDGVSGPLRGLVGSNEAIGAFHGHSDNQVHAGGFIVN